MVWLASLVATAQQVVSVPEVNAQLYRPPIDATTLLWTESAGEIVSGFRSVPRFAAQHVHRPFVVDQPQTVMVDHALQLDAVLGTAYGPLRLAVDLPIHMLTLGERTEDGIALGDTTVDARVTLLDPSTAAIGAALSGGVTVASGTLEAPLGDRLPSGQLRTALERRWSERTVTALNLGIRFGPEVDVIDAVFDDHLLASLGASHGLSDTIGLSVDVAGRAGIGRTSGAGVPIEALLGGYAHTGDGWTIRLGAGRGLTSAVGAPQLRALAMLSYRPPQDLDRDGDGIPDVADACSTAAEDVDGFEDADGCPDPLHPVTIEAVGADGAPLPRARIELQPGAQPDPTSGVLELHPGRYVAVIEAPGHAPAEHAFTVPTAGPVVVALEPDAVRVRGQLVVRGARLEVGKPLVWRDGALAPDSAPILDEAAQLLEARGYVREVVFVIQGSDEPGVVDAVQQALLQRGLDPQRVLELSVIEDTP